MRAPSSILKSSGRRAQHAAVGPSWYPSDAPLAPSCPTSLLLPSNSSGRGSTKASLHLCLSLDLGTLLRTLLNNSVLSFRMTPDYYKGFSPPLPHPPLFPPITFKFFSHVNRFKGSRVRKTHNEEVAALPLCCQFDKYNVSPIKNSLPFSRRSHCLVKVLLPGWLPGSTAIIVDNRGAVFFPSWAISALHIGM